MTIPDEPCCHRIVALMDRCKGLVAELAAAREEIARKDAENEWNKGRVSKFQDEIRAIREEYVRQQYGKSFPSPVMISGLGAGNLVWGA